MINMRVKKRVAIAVLTVIMASSLSACQKSVEDEPESVIEFSEFLPSEPEPVIVREEVTEAETETETEMESVVETVTPYADRIAGDAPVSYDIGSDTYEEGAVKIVYPKISGMENEDLEASINDKIYRSALSGSSEEGLTAYELEFETATKGEGLVSFIFRGYINYEQSAYPTSIIKTLNINMTTGDVLSLKDYADMGEIVSDLETASGYVILNDGVDLPDFDTFLNNGYMTDYAMLLLDYDSNSSGYSAIRNNHLVLFVEAEHAMGDYVELEFQKDL